MATPVTLQNDFPDRISPMLVKELRQGLRAKTFIAVFLSLQVALATMLLSASASSSSHQAGSVISGVIFSFFAIAVLLIQPLRGITALSSEIKGNTIDMMVLTRLSAWRIVFGKWVAIVSQSALLLAAIVPYLILRYFFGGMNLFAEMVLLALLFLTSMALTAVTVGFSGSSSVIIRALLPVFGIPVMLYSFLMLLIFGMGRMGTQGLFAFLALDSPESRIAVFAYVTSITYLGWSSLSLGASLIAPAAENHATLRRLITLLLFTALAPFIFLKKIDLDLLPFLLFLVLAPAFSIALTESNHLTASVRQSFTRRGLPGKLAALFLAPGWPSGVFFTTLLTAFAVLAFLWLSAGTRPMLFGNNNDLWIVSLSLLGWLLFPATIQSLSSKSGHQRISSYLLLLLGTGVLCGVLSLLADTMSNSGFLWLFIWNPLVFLPILSESKVSDSTILTAAIGVNTILLLILNLTAAFAFLHNWKTSEEATTPTPDPS